MNNQHWKERDLAVIWHPCTQMKDHEQLPLIPIRSGKGVWLDSLPAKWIADVDIPPDPSFSGIPLRQSSLQFISLTEAQRARLKEYISRFTEENE